MDENHWKTAIGELMSNLIAEAHTLRDMAEGTVGTPAEKAQWAAESREKLRIAHRLTQIPARVGGLARAAEIAEANAAIQATEIATEIAEGVTS